MQRESHSMSNSSAKRTRRQRLLGAILYDGPSMIDGEPIAVIATGFKRASANPKTGDMLQTWVLRSDMKPFSAVHSGADASICGSCPLRGIVEKSNGQHATVNRRRACYVNVHQAPTAVYQAFTRGRYEPFDAGQHLDLFRGRMLRIGSYGDPCAAPYSVWSTFTRASRGRTGYTHQWREGRFWRFRRLVMASVESLADAELAWSRGWRTFRTTIAGEQSTTREFVCPASAEAGHRLTCDQCGACDGAANSAKTGQHRHSRRMARQRRCGRTTGSLAITSATTRHRTS